MKLSELSEKIKECIKNGVVDEVVSYNGAYSEKGQCDITIGIKRNNIALDLIVKTDDKLETLDNSVDLALEVYRYDLVNNLGFIDDLETPKESVKVGESVEEDKKHEHKEMDSSLYKCLNCGFEYEYLHDKGEQPAKWCQWCQVSAMLPVFDKSKREKESEVKQKLQPYKESGTPHDVVNNPSHYKRGEIECYEALKASMTKDQFLGHLKATAIAYLWRYDLKNGLEDVKKAKWYVDQMVKELGGE